MNPSATSAELRPLAIGEIIDRAATFWRAHLKPLFVLCLGFDLVNYIAVKVFTFAMTRVVGVLPGLQGPSAGTNPREALTQSGIAMGMMGVLYVFLIWNFWFATTAAARYVVPAHLGDPVRPMDGLRRAVSRLGTLTATYLLSLGWSLGVTVLLCLPGSIVMGLAVVAVVTGKGAGGSTALSVALIIIGAILLGLGGLAAVLWYFLRFMLLPPVLAMEDVGAWTAFKRSGALLSGRVEPGFMGRGTVRAMVLSTVVGGILVAVSLVSGLPAWIVRLTYGGNLLDPAAQAAIPQALLVPAELLQVVGQSFFTPLSFVVSAFFYVDMRVRREGLDLERRLATPDPTTQST
ncbi:hypothetical protein D7Y13_11950 [Corallococcus praedator]|uniref:Glycerophosphoryl diester phosphodiesterase membrane domain-containing protein n=1 Tax=Corallococcus praedator TaxID=2316724 RepID=A0ABX9QK41_9BACT|nr:MULTISPECIES: hypothetical protein [Corallococcus]RKH35127.1 hypothetical protein D7X75_05340 [Corallococcus sp. CA031C]RKI10888.1 hypothetical protein D7Y13_11950 [Corallococcus praedator]